MSQRQLWVSVLRRLQPTIKKADFITWFQNTDVIEVKDKMVLVGVPSVFAQDWLSRKYGVKILQAVREVNAEITDIEYKVVGKLADKTDKSGVDVKALFADLDKKVRKVQKEDAVRISSGPAVSKVYSKMLNQRYQLENFIVGNENQLPYAAAQAVSKAPGGIYNPLYIFGSVGLGKTHLVQAIGNSILKNFEEKVVKYITAEQFVSDMIDSIGRRNMAKFKEQYRNVDCLIVDDVQFFARKNSSQQEFFHTFNELYNNNKQVILTSDRPPSELDDLDARLKSRFAMGMVVEILVPDFETRLAILRQKCQEYQMIMDPEVLKFIANNVTTSVRELEAVLRQAMAECELTQSTSSIRSVAEIIKRIDKARKIIGYDPDQENVRKYALTLEEVMGAVSDYFKVSVDDLVSGNRHKEIMVPRQVCMYLIKSELGYSYEKIGEGFGGRNHTTVMHACNKTAKKLRKDVNLLRDINSIKREMGL